MATVAGVRFKRGLEIGEAVTGAREVSDDQIVAPLKPIVRIATPEDEQHQVWCEQRERKPSRCAWKRWKSWGWK